MAQTECYLQYSQDLYKFMENCKKLQDTHLKVYLAIITFKKSKELLLFTINEIEEMMEMCTNLQSKNPEHILIDIFKETALLIDNESSQNACQRILLTQLSANCINWQLVLVIYDLWPDLFTPALIMQICELFYNSMKETQIQSLCLVRHILTNNVSMELLANIWYKAKCYLAIDRIEGLVVMSFFLDFYMALEQASRILIDDKEFRKHIQRGLLSTNQLNRKYSYFLLRKISGLCPEKNQPGNWELFFIIFETLQEQPSHIVLPSFNLLPKLWTSLPSHWIHLLLIIFLRHNNKLVIEHSVFYVLRNVNISAKDLIEHRDITLELIQQTLNVLNSTFLYGSNEIMASDLTKFLAPIFTQFKNGIQTILWKSVPWYFVLTSILALDGIDHEFGNELVRITQSIPNVAIRKHLIGLIEQQCNEVLNNRKICDSLQVDADLKQIGDKISVKSLISILNSEDVSNELKIEILLSIHQKDFKELHSFPPEVLMSAIVCLQPQHKGTTLAILKCLFNNLNFNNKQLIDVVLSVFKVCSIDERRQFLQEYLASSNGNNFKEKYFIYKLAIIDTSNRTIFIDYLKCEPDLELLLSDIFDHFGADGLQLILDLIHKDFLQTGKIVDLCFNQLISLAYDSMFLKLTEKFLLATEELILENECFYYDKLLELSTKVKGLMQVLFKSNKLTKYRKFILSALLFGEPLKGDQRIEYEIVKIIYGNDIPIENIEGPHIRSKMLFKLGQLQLSTDEIQHLKNDLLTQSENLNKQKPRYFADSQQHRLKLRIVQGLAALFALDPQWDERLFHFLLNENNQTNITLIVECIIGTIISWDRLANLIEQANSNHSRQSIFVVMFYVCKRMADRGLADSCIKRILPWTMGQHFNTRIIAQIVIMKLMDNFTELRNEYGVIYESIIYSFEQHNAKILSQHYRKDIRFCRLVCTDLLNPIYYLCEIPRLTNMTADELVPLRFVPTDYFDKVTPLDDCDPIKVTTRAVPDELTDSLAVENIQKKITPIKEIIPESIETMSERVAIQKKQQNGLIVVASLVSRSPNLGGLSRTCEIFGIDELVLDSLQHINKKEFQALSMTSEKWLKISEIKPWHLIDYIIKMKNEGYSIIGAEQTANGHQITNVKLPKRMILILGHEKEGIPPDIITLLDMAIEIPQFGVVRSLNVHVTGAIFMWEYVKQHINQK